jgi:hypothetical protein
MRFALIMNWKRFFSRKSRKLLNVASKWEKGLMETIPAIKVQVAPVKVRRVIKADA